MRRHPPVIALVSLILLSSAGCGREKSQVMARVNQQPITQQQLWDALEKADNGEAGRRTLDSLIVRQLIRQEAQKRGIQVDRDELQSRLDGLKDYILAASGKDFGTWLTETGQTEQDVAARVSLQILTAKLVLTPDDRKKYFEENKERLATLPHNSESVICRQIVVGSKEEAAAIRKELAEAAPDKGVTGTEFGKIAEARSLDTFTRQRGGMVGWVVKGKSADPELEKVLFSLKPGEVSEPLPVPAPTGATEDIPEQEETEEGAPPQRWRIVMVDKHIPPHDLTLEGNADVVEEWMLNDPRFQMQLHEFFAGLRARADVEILSPRYQAIEDAYRQGREERERRLAPPTGLVPSPAPAEGERPAPTAPNQESRPADK